MKDLSTIIVLFPAFFLTISLAAQNPVKENGPAASQVIEKIIAKTGSAQIPNTVDIIKEGTPETPVKGIVTTMFGTMKVLKKAVDLNCNLIIVHEPLYYNHLDETKQFQNDPVFLEKQKFIKDIPLHFVESGPSFWSY